MKNKQQGFIIPLTVTIVTLLAIGGGAYLYMQKDAPKYEKTEEMTFEADAKPSDEVSLTSIIGNNKPLTKPEIKSDSKKIEVKKETEVTSVDPWVVIEKYKAFLKAHDLDGLNSISYNKNLSCDTKEECEMIFSLLEIQFAKLNKADYVNRWEDSKQIILNKNIKISDGSFDRDSMKFARDTDGSLKLVMISSYSNNEEKSMTDSDKDGLTDQEEKCEGASKHRGNCKTTDPSKRDTDGDGWWDGVEADFQ